MKLTEHQIIKNYAKYCGHCNLNTLLSYEYEFTRFSCGLNLIKRKHEFTKTQRKKVSLIV